MTYRPLPSKAGGRGYSSNSIVVIKGKRTAADDNCLYSLYIIANMYLI